MKDLSALDYDYIRAAVQQLIGKVYIRREEVDCDDIVFEQLEKLEYITRMDGIWKVNITADEMEKTTTEELKLPEDLFSIIEGYEDLKDVFIKSLTASSPVHILLVGNPGTAKTIFMMEIERLGGKLILGGTSSKVGIRDILLDEAPTILIIDEINEINSGKDLTALLTWMESQRVIVAKSGDHREREGKGWVFGACNTTKNISTAILSRFLKFHFEEYSKEEFVKVCIAVLTKRESTDEELARDIAVKLAIRGYRDVRDAIKVARLSSTKEEVDKIIETMVKYGKEDR